jgi:ribosomal protein S20
MPRLDLEYTFFHRETNKLIALHANINPLPPAYQKLVAEIIVLRLFDLLQNAIKSTVVKIICRARYIDGSDPLILEPAGSIHEALSKMESHNRKKPRKNLKWSKVKYINKNVEHVISRSDHLLIVLNMYASFVEEVRRVRNRIAHNNTNSREKYRLVVKTHYGAYVNSVTPGILLLSPRRTPTIMEQYLRKCRILVKEMMKA